MEPLVDNRGQAERQNMSHFQHHDRSNGLMENDDQFQNGDFKEEGQAEENT